MRLDRQDYTSDIVKSNVGNEIDYQEIDKNDDGVVTRQELVDYLKANGLLDAEANDVADFLGLGSDPDATISWSDFNEGVAKWTTNTILAVNTGIEHDTNAERYDGEFVQFQREDGTYGWAVEGDDGKYYEVTSGDGNEQSFSDFKGTGLQISDEPLDSALIVSNSNPEDTTIKAIDGPPPGLEFTKTGPDGSPIPLQNPITDDRKGTWYEVTNPDGSKNYIFVEEKNTNPDDPASGKGYVDVWVFDGEGKLTTSLTGDPHVDADGDGDSDFHYDGASSFRIGNVVIEARTTDLSGGTADNTTYNTGLTISNGTDYATLDIEAQDGGQPATRVDNSRYEEATDLETQWKEFIRMDVNLTGHDAAFIVFLQSSDLMDELTKDTLNSLQDRNAEIQELRESRSALTRIKNGAEFAENGDWQGPPITGDDATNVILSDLMSAGDQRQRPGWTVAYETNDAGKEVPFVLVDGERWDGDPPLQLSKDEFDALDKQIDGRIQQLSGEVELIMVSVKSFLTKREGMTGILGGVTQGQGTMMSKSNG